MPNQEEALTSSEKTHEVVLPMNVSLAESIKVDLPPTVTKMVIPSSWFVQSVQPK